MQLDPRPEPAPMTDAEIAKLIPPKGKESFVHWYFMHIDLEPDWKTAMPSCGPRFSSRTGSLRIFTEKAFKPKRLALKTSMPDAALRPNCLKRLRAEPILPNGVFADALSARNGELSKL